MKESIFIKNLTSIYNSKLPDFVGLKSQLIDTDFVKKTRYATKRYFSEIN